VTNELCTVHYVPTITIAKTGLVDDTAKVPAPGDGVTWDFVVTNTGPVALTAMTLVDTMHPDTQFAWGECTAADGMVFGPEESLSSLIMQPGDVLTCAGTSVLTQADIDAGLQINLNVTVTGTTEPVLDADGNVLDEGTTVSAESAASVQVSVTPGIELTKTAKLAEDESSVTWQFTMTNTGNTTLQEVSVTDEFPGLSEITYTWPDETRPGVLLPGEVGYGQATSVVTDEHREAGRILNTALVTGDVPPTEPTEPTEPEPTPTPTPSITPTPNDSTPSPSVSDEDTAEVILPTPTPVAPTGGGLATAGWLGWVALLAGLGACGALVLAGWRWRHTS
jgi:uncharacterized repeat protein (TIGR01451 family)